MKKILSFLVAIIAAVWFSITLEARNNEMVVATYNLRLSNPNDSAAGNGWGLRAPHIANLIKFHGFDLFGTQEGFRHMLEQLKDSLQGFN